MEKQLINFTSGFLRMNRVVLFLLIAFPLTLRFYASPSDDLAAFNRLFASVGGICLLCWIFAIGHRANAKLESQGIYLNAFRFFNWTFILIAVTFIFTLFVSSDLNTTFNGINVHYTQPIFLTVLLIFAFVFTIFIAAKTLVSAELNKDAGIGEYFTTMLLMLFAAIGLWFIQPRVQNI